MSYSNINDAFNIDSNFENTIRGLNNFNPMDNTFENINSAYNSNLNSTKTNSDYYSNYYSSKQFQYPLYNENNSLGSLNGTDLLGEINNKPNSTSKSSNKMSTKPSKKLTHMDCIKIYNNPDVYKDSDLTIGLKHVSVCKTCKEHIKQSMVSNNILSESNKKKISNNDNMEEKSNLNPNQISTMNNSNQINSKLETELKLLNNKINEESNLKYQNTILQNNLSKYLEDLEEKKKINYKLDKIIEMVNLNLVKTNKLENLYGTNPNYNYGYGTEMDPRILSNLIKFNHPNMNMNMGNIGWENYILYIGISIIILLLIIDIIIRFAFKSQ